MSQCEKQGIPHDETDDGHGTCTCGQKRGVERQHCSPNTDLMNPPRFFSSSSYDLESAAGSSTTVQREIAKLRRENQDVIRQIKEVTKMNTRWQRYDKEREDVVLDLTSRLQKYQERTQDLEAKNFEQRERIDDLELRLTDARVRATERKAELERVQRESKTLEIHLKQSEQKRHESNKQLDVALKHKLRKDEDVRRERTDLHKDKDASKHVIELKERVDHLQQELQTCRKQMDEQSDLYTQQISICLDDFKQEKRDKDRLKEENLNIKKQLKKAEDFASSLKVQITRYQAQQRQQQPLHPPSHLNHRHFASIYQEPLGDSWDDADYALPSDVIADRGHGFDEVDVGEVRRPTGAAVIDQPPHYDDRSVMGQLVSPKVKGYNGQRSPVKMATADLVLH